MTGKPKPTKSQVLAELNQLRKQVERFQRRAARSEMPTPWWDAILGIQNAVDEATDRIEASRLE